VSYYDLIRKEICLIEEMLENTLDTRRKSDFQRPDKAELWSMTSNQQELAQTAF